MTESYGIHWFRRDLRVAGNPALKWNCRKHHGRTLGIFCFDKKFLDRSDISLNRFQFLIETLIELREELCQLGGDLLILEGEPHKAFPNFFKYLKQHKVSLPDTISWNRDYEPFSRLRDNKMEPILKKDFNVYTERDHLLIEPHELYKGDDQNQGYQVFTPFYKKWLELFRSVEVQDRIKEQRLSFDSSNKIHKGDLKYRFKLTWKDLLKDKLKFADKLKKYSNNNRAYITISIPKAGSKEALKGIYEFRSRINDYKIGRDFPAQSANSRFSLYLKNGSLTISQIIAFLELNKDGEKSSSSTESFLRQLVWREFYYHILYRFPKVESSSFNPKFKSIAWQNNEDWFSAWKDGRTGYPLIDAGMRELKNTGYMHNRVRMLVASFLTKDLLIDWRWGEQYFMKQLLDGDLAANNGGWQWAASTGCDPQPYFRIFNPWIQSKKFDPAGIYIKKYIPELRDVDSKNLHKPILNHTSYPSPIVDHKEQRKKALNLYKTAMLKS
jgi:deoxyribodipyrimidine photo-lyase